MAAHENGVLTPIFSLLSACCMNFGRLNSTVPTGSVLLTGDRQLLAAYTSFPWQIDRPGARDIVNFPAQALSIEREGQECILLPLISSGG